MPLLAQELGLELGRRRGKEGEEDGAGANEEQAAPGRAGPGSQTTAGGNEKRGADDRCNWRAGPCRPLFLSLAKWPSLANCLSLAK